MHLFVVYAVTVWFVAFRWRRKLGGIAVIAAAMVGLHFFNLIHGDFAAMFAYDARIFRAAPRHGRPVPRPPRRVASP